MAVLYDGGILINYFMECMVAQTQKIINMLELIEELRELEAKLSDIRDTEVKFEEELSNLHRAVSELLSAVGRN
jgi:hypothetical protein